MKKFTRVQDFEDHALKTMASDVRDFYCFGAGSGHSMRLNSEAYKRIRILPRVLKNVSKRDISTTALGQKVSSPIGVSPTGMQKGAHPDGECANAKAAETAGSLFVLSVFSTSTIREVAEAAPNAIKWFQMSLLKDRDAAIHFAREAEQAGFKAIVLTVDNPVAPKSKLGSVLHGVEYAVIRDFFRAKYPEKADEFKNSWATSMIDDSLTWEDVAWMRRNTRLPIIVKGILTPEDAVLAVKYGVSGIVVSNHGGRQFDGTPATIEALPRIVKAVGDRIEVYVDGGIRSGSDVFKALALGAKMVFVGRPMLWGLACDGEQGAKSVLDILRQELDEIFAMTGCSRVQDITRDLVMHESCLSHF